MTRATAVLLAVLLLASPASAAPRWLGRMIRVGIVAGAAIADGVTTQQLIARGDYERNPILGRYPSPARIYLTGATFWVPVEILVERRKSKRLAWAVDLIGAGIHIYWAAHNSGLPACPLARTDN